MKSSDEKLLNRMRRHSTRLRCQRMGPERTPVLSLDADPGLVGSEPEAELVAGFDWGNLCARFGLTRLEERAVLHHLRHGVGRYRLHTELGVTRSEAIAALTKGLAKLQRHPHVVGFVPVQNSRRLVYRENFGGGRRPWALNPLPPEFAAVMQAERNYFRLTPLADTVGSAKSGVILALSIVRRKLVDLKASLQTEQQKLSRVSETLHRYRTSKEQADRDLNTGLEELQRASAQAILEGKSLNHSQLESKLAELQRNARTGQAEFEAFPAQWDPKLGIHVT